MLNFHAVDTGRTGDRTIWFHGMYGLIYFLWKITWKKLELDQKAELIFIFYDRKLSQK